MYSGGVREVSPFVEGVREYKVLVLHHSLEVIVIEKLGAYICRLILYNNPGSYPKIHDVREMAASFALFYQMFGKHYLVDIERLSNVAVVSGKPGQSSY